LVLGDLIDQASFGDLGDRTSLGNLGALTSLGDLGNLTFGSRNTASVPSVVNKLSAISANFLLG